MIAVFIRIDNRAGFEFRNYEFMELIFNGQQIFCFDQLNFFK